MFSGSSPALDGHLLTVVLFTVLQGKQPHTQMCLNQGQPAWKEPQQESSLQQSSLIKSPFLSLQTQPALILFSVPGQHAETSGRPASDPH